MNEEITFYTNPMSRGRIARWMLEELGQPYRTEMLEYGTSMKAPEYLAVNPMGKVPAIRHGETVVTEAAAICAYLADAFPQAGLAPPPGDPGRAPYYRWMFFAAGPIEAVFTAKAMGWEAPPERRAMLGFGCEAEALSAVERMLGSSEHVAGDRFSAADVYLGGQLGFMLQFGMLEPRPAFTDYVGRIQARPAYKRAAEIDDALMPAQPA
jgi:glutathione S-transferase